MLALLKKRFEENRNRHPDLDWAEVEKRLLENPDALQVLEKMEKSGGEPDTIGFADDTSFQNWIDRMVSHSDFKTDVQVTPDDHIITLSTCSYEWYDARYVVLGKMVPIG